MTDNNKTVAIIPCAGSGVRMGAGRAKQFLEIKDMPILGLTLARFQACTMIGSITLVAPGADLDFCGKEIVERFGLTKVTRIVEGGARRQDSVRLGLEATRGACDIAVIHDGVRPFIDNDLIERCVRGAMEDRAVIAAIPAKDTVKRVSENGFIQETYDRTTVWLVQTPQVFRFEDIMLAHERAVKEGWEDVTDDASLIERMGIPVKVIMGTEYNIKITTPHDMELGRIFLEEASG